MKKIILAFLLTLVPLFGFSQITEGFEGSTFPPVNSGNWLTMDNGVGTGVSWTETNDPTRVYAGTKSAIIDRENIGTGNTSEDWLVTSQITIPANGQLKFFTRQTLSGDNGSIYEIRVSTNPNQTNQSAFITLQSWTETSLNSIYNVYEEKIVDLNTYSGQSIYIAFVKKNTQVSSTTSGDRWLIDDIKVIEKCPDPSTLGVSNITPTTADLSWINNGAATSWEVKVQSPGTGTPTGAGVSTTTNPYTVTSLTPSTTYEFYVKSNCGNGNFSQWIGPFNFVTTPAGSICSVPITIPALPYSHTANTITYGDEFDLSQGTTCGATPSTTNYLQGSEVFYTYTPSFTGNISITMSPGANSSSLFVYNSCANVGVTCLAGVANNTSSVRTISSLAVTAGQTYIIVVSSSTTPAGGIPYTLIIQQVNCQQPGSLTATNISTNSADLSWSNPSGANSWEIVVQTAGSNIPTGSGTTVTTNTNYTVTGLNTATAYQYWVRADCGNGTFSAWSGPFLFNTKICNSSQQCNYTFRMFDKIWGWEGARMEVRQNGIVVTTLGSTFTSGAGPVDITVPVCDNVPLELYWTVPGSFADEVGISIINNFSQTIYTKPIGSGSSSTTTPIFSTSISCTTPACLKPTALASNTITTNGATLSWTADSGITTWDIYVVPFGSPAPSSTSTPTYANVTTNPFTINGLNPNTKYDFYIKNICSATSSSNWEGPKNFTTLPTCLSPNNLSVSNITPSSAQLSWTQQPHPSGSNPSMWKVIVLPCGSPSPTPSTSGWVSVNSTTYQSLGLNPLSCYDFYVMAVCSANDNSPISTSFKFYTPDTNDECINAKIVPVNQNTSCLQTVYGTVLQATASSQNNTCGANDDDDDVWFKFVATATTHYVSLLAPNTSTTNPPIFPDTDVDPSGLYYSLYTGSNCSGLTQVSCKTSTNGIESGLTVGQTYWVRVYSEDSLVSSQSFEICIGTKIIYCQNSFPLCAITPIIKRNDVGVPDTPNPIDGTNTSAVGCLGRAPSPTFYFLKIPQNGNYEFLIEQNVDSSFPATSWFDPKGLDVDYVAWGPFNDLSTACSSINLNNTLPDPDGCSYSIDPTETFTINGALAGEVYILMITNYTARSNPPGNRGYIRITQTRGPIPTVCCPFTNFSYSSSFYCKNGTNPLPILMSGATAGTYSCSNSSLQLNPTTGEIDLANSTSGTYTITSEIQATGDCPTATSTWSITISEPPSATVSYSANTYCTNELIQTPTITSNATGYFSVTPTVGLTINPTTGVIDPSSSQPGSYMVHYSISNISGCTTLIVDIPITINLQPQATLLSSDSDNTICSDQTATLSVNPINFALADATYSWTLNGTPISSATSSTITPVTSGTYQATIDLKGCITSTQSILFTVNPVPNFDLTGTNLVKCANEQAVLTITGLNFNVNDPTITYQWYKNGILINGATSYTYTTTAFDTYKALVTINNCSFFKNITVSLDTTDIPIETKGECIGTNYTITASPISNSFNSQNVNYQWYLGNSNTGSLITNATLNTLNVSEYMSNNNVALSSFPLTFEVKITTNPEGCVDTQQFLVKSPKCIIQKGISPNGDGDNDVLDLVALDVKLLSIFNRYGTKVYALSNYTDQWHGQSDNGQDLPDGTYYMVIEQNNGETKSGWIYINR